MRRGSKETGNEPLGLVGKKLAPVKSSSSEGTSRVTDHTRVLSVECPSSPLEKHSVKNSPGARSTKINVGWDRTLSQTLHGQYRSSFAQIGLVPQVFPTLTLNKCISNVKTGCLWCRTHIYHQNPQFPKDLQSLLLFSLTLWQCGHNF